MDFAQWVSAGLNCRPNSNSRLPLAESNPPRPRTAQIDVDPGPAVLTATRRCSLSRTLREQIFQSVQGLLRKAL